MKRINTTIILALGISAASAQTVEAGNSQIYYERYTSAQHSYQQALQQQPDDAGAWYGLSRAYLLQEESAKGLDSLRQAPAAVNDDPYFQVALGTLLLDQNKKDSAKYFFDEALDKTREKNAGVLLAIASAQIEAKNGDPNYALQLLEKAAKRDKHNPAIYVAQGDAYRKVANGSEAYKAYKKALEEDPAYAAAYHKLGEIFLTQKSADLYLSYFNQAVAADSNYAPSLYKLYAYNFYHDPAKAYDYFNKYLSKSDPGIQNQYDLADLFYLNKEYTKALDEAKGIVSSQPSVKPRLYKLMSYSYAGLSDTATAITYMNKYFRSEADSNIISKDYESLGDFYAANASDSAAVDSASLYYARAAAIEKDKAARYAYYKKLAGWAEARKDYATQAKWLEKFYEGNDKATNLDLFYWGLAGYRADDYQMADTVFGNYVKLYPEQSFGYYWKARADAAMDKEMEKGLAVPVYQQLITVLQKDSTDVNYKKWMVEAYGYLAAYEVNHEKDYAQAVDLFEKVLEVDPENASAKKYITILEKDLSGSDVMDKDKETTQKELTNKGS